MDVHENVFTFMKMFSRSQKSVRLHFFHATSEITDSHTKSEKNHSVKMCAFGRGKSPHVRGIDVKNVKTKIA